MGITGDLFDGNTVSFERAEKNMPLAARMRPREMAHFFGQEHLLGNNKELQRVIDSDCFSSLIFYGPPGTGKTTLAHLIALKTRRMFIAVSAAISNMQEVRRIIDDASRKQRLGMKTILFIDEIHRFNKAQQDLLLPYIENGTIGFIGATTHNPFFSCIAPLVSRSQVFRLKSLTSEAIIKILDRALNDEAYGLGKHKVRMENTFLIKISRFCEGDARRALNTLEIAVLSAPVEGEVKVLKEKNLNSILGEKPIVYDKDEDAHYDTISAFIKSMRGSDPDAALYWLAVMIHGGEDILFIARRMVILASEDIGNADPQALQMAVACLHAVEFIGLPEARIPLAQTVIYLSCAPKSNASYIAIEKALKDVRSDKTEAVPGTLKNVKGPDEKDQHYICPHSNPNSHMDYLPSFKWFLTLTDVGYESQMKRRLESWARLRAKNKENITED